MLTTKRGRMMYLSSSMQTVGVSNNYCVNRNRTCSEIDTLHHPLDCPVGNIGKRC
jgi:hypothetical protein